MNLSFRLLIISFLLLCYSHSKTNDSLIVGYSTAAPFLYEVNNDVEGPLAWLWKSIAEENAIQYEIGKLKSEELLENLKSENIDLAIYPLSITSARSQKNEFLSSILFSSFRNYD